MDCIHSSFAANVDVHPVVIGNSILYMSDIRISCADCGAPMIFNGVNEGLSFGCPTRSSDGFELHAPLRPVGTRPVNMSLPMLHPTAREDAN